MYVKIYIMINSQKICIFIMFLVVGIFCFKPVQAAKPADFGLREGEMISASDSSDPDIYIINEQGYKRLFLNPTMFQLQLFLHLCLVAFFQTFLETYIYKNLFINTFFISSNYFQDIPLIRECQIYYQSVSRQSKKNS